MMMTTDQTHDPRLLSWVESANERETDFPIQNLPLGVFRTASSSEPFRVGAAIGDFILDIGAAGRAGHLSRDADRAVEACGDSSLNSVMSLGRPDWRILRMEISRLLSEAGGLDAGRDAAHLLVSQADAEMTLPAVVGDYTDFYASIFHATNVGSLFRPDNPLLPNYKHVVVGYHGRASSLVPSGTPIRRPQGQSNPNNSSQPSFGPTKLLDYELEVGFFVGPGNEIGEPIAIETAEDHIFGLCLVNDWSARDIQAWEYQPLGPFMGKSFATTVSPWVVTLEALAPFRIPAFERPEEDPRPLLHLDSSADRASGGVDIQLEVRLSTRRMREASRPPQKLSHGSFANMYWTISQMLTHHASNGCNLRPGDLMASGTVSGPERESRGCLLELTRRGAEPLQLSAGESRKFLEDGDEVILTGYCQNSEFRRIGFGESRGRIVPT